MPRKAKHTADGAAASGGYVVGIGASAGGLEAINAFFDNIPGDTGFSFVVIQHLSPDYKSLMAELLAKHTEMKVFEATEGMSLKSNCIYLIPTKKVLTLKGGRLHLEEKLRTNHPNTTIDIFFESLARDRGEKAVGIILSGTGSDGSRGISAIKNNGGTVVVQDPVSAAFDGMPNSGLATGYADLILSPEMMPDELIHFLKEAPLIRSFHQLNNQEEAIIADVLELILKVTQHDFSHYKRPTLTRRLAKRMAEKGTKSLSEYYEFLLNHPDEVRALCQEFLINVTRFFRDEEAFEVIQQNVIPSLFKNKEAGDTIKVWVVAASTGEEAYTLAMLFEEFMELQKRYDVSVKIFATDIDGQAIEMASKGIYTEEAVKGIAADRLKRFFVKEGHTYKVSSSLRKTVVFAKHDITKDPPFSRIDLLTCRNMLIYMNALLQKNILQKFHFALNEDGYLFLGNSENLGVLKDVMKDIDKKWKIYQCISKNKTTEYEAFLNPTNRTGLTLPTPKAKNALTHLAEIFKDTLLDEYQFAGIFIDRDFEVKQAVGAFKHFISFPESNFNFNLLKLVPPDLSVALSTCIRKAIKENEKVVQKRVKVQDGKGHRLLNIVVKPYLNQKTYLQPFLFIILNEAEQDAKPVSRSITTTKKDVVSRRIEELEAELKDTKENLQAVVEEVESANEELQSSNEEIISSNEELQSTNEELQSLNEELHTVNAEHQLKIKELMELNDDLNNYFNNSEVGQILIDRNLVVRKFTPFAKKQVNLIESDVGRSITDISTNFKDRRFIGQIRSVMETGVREEEEILMEDGGVYHMRIAPFFRQDRSIDGVVVNFIDISQLKTLNSIIEAVLNSSTSGILANKAIRDKQNTIIDFEYISVNKAAEKMLHTTEKAMVGQRLKKLFPEMADAYFIDYVEIVETGQTRHFEFFYDKVGRWYDIICVKMMDGLVTTFTDVTERKKAADLLALGYEELKSTTKQLERSNMDLLQFASVASHDLKEPLRKIQAFGNLLRDKVRDKLGDAENKYIEKMINSSNRMQNLVDDILTLSRLSNTEVPFTKVDLNEIINNIADDLEVTIRDKNAVIKADQLSVTHAVPGQMHQLFQNLITNGLKFNEHKQPAIRITQKAMPKKWAGELGINAKDFHVVEVSDNGIGFEQKYAEKIFGIFQRLDGNSYQGSGIGLAICQKIMDNHKGYIKAESTPGRGTKFLLAFAKE
ncbi:MAG: chemotaxis protein [Chitinophagaceae bacterium]|jgi:two-component system CheB/CheR fusion protein|nr:chemotaxis protein [Chitinophagaceae bacterium]